MNTILLQTADAGAAAMANGGGTNWQFIGMIVLIFGIMYFLMIRPQQKRQKELNKFRSQLQNGAKVVTAGGIYGTVKEVNDDSVLVEIDNGVKIRVAKSMVMRDPSDMQQR